MNSAKAILRKAIIEQAYISSNDEQVWSKSGTKQQWLFDFRRIVLFPEIIDAYSSLFDSYFGEKMGPLQIGGMETAAIPIVTGMNYVLNKRGRKVNPFYIRKSRKKDGLLRIIEGELNDDPIVLVDDLINSASSVRKQVEILEALGKTVSAVFVLLRYRDEDAYEYFREKNIRFISVFDLNDLKDELPVSNIKGADRPLPPPIATKLWYFKSEKPNYFLVAPKSAPAIDTQNIYFGSDAGIMWALDQESGDIKWKFKIRFGAGGKFIISSPLVHDDVVYFGAYDGNVYALDTTTGLPRWVFKEADWVGSSPTVSTRHGLLFIGLEFGLWKKHGSIVALDIHTGEKKWEHHSEEFTHCSPLYIEKQELVICGSNDNVVYALSAKDGKLKWKIVTGGPIKERPAHNADGSLVSFNSFDRYCYVIETKTGKIISRLETDEALYSEPLFIDEMVVTASLDKKVYAFNARTGEMTWSFPTSGRIFASPILVEGNIVIGSNDGILYVIDPNTGKPRGRFAVTERITNKVAYNKERGLLFLPTFANEIYGLKWSVHDLTTDAWDFQSGRGISKKALET